MEQTVRIRFRVLGPVEILGDDGPLTAAPRHRAVLAYLLLNAGRACSAERLADAMWGVETPDTARAQIHASIAAIRRVLRDCGRDPVLVTTPAGYVVTPEPGEFDLAVFRDEIASVAVGSQVDPIARRDSVGHSAAPQFGAGSLVLTLRRALALWQGEPLAGVHAEFAAGERRRLRDRRLAAVELLMEAELAAHQHEQVLDELAAEVAAHPGRERLAGQLVLALYRSGRQADALAAARALRAVLAENQGLDPGRAFAELEAAVLRADPALDLPAPDSVVPATPATVVTAAVAAQASSGISIPEAPRPASPTRSAGAVPANFLPYDLPDFAGREVELAAIVADSNSIPPVSIWTIDGMAGIGKTALAVHAAHRLTDSCPHGQLFLDLQAHTPGADPVPVEIATAVLLRQLGMAADHIPDSAAERAALWRSELGRRRVVVVLDNVRDSEQVRPLLPGSAGSIVIITSRRRLVDLDGARTLSMETLTARDAVDLFGAIVGPRAAAEPVAVLDVAQLCGFLPLAVRIAAARLTHRSRWTVGYLGDRLRDERRRLAELATAERGVAAAFALSYDQLEPLPQRMFRLLGLHPGTDIDAAAAAALAGTDLDSAETVLEDLLDVHMVAQRRLGRYTMHDLLRDQARAAADSDSDRARAVTRLLTFYLYSARAAVDLVFAHSAADREALPGTDIEWTRFGGPVPAAAWLDAERDNLVAAVCAAATTEVDGQRLAVLLAATLRPYLDGNSHHSDSRRVHQAALDASTRLGDEVARGRALTDLGWTAWRRGELTAAADYSQDAVDVNRRAGSRYELARALNTLGNVEARRDDLAAARGWLEEALELAQELGSRVGEAHVLGNLGLVLARTGDDRAAQDHLDRALALHRRLGNRHGEALVHNHCGVIAGERRDDRPAREHHRQAARLYRALGNAVEEAATRNTLGEYLRRTGDPAAALAEHTAALELIAAAHPGIELARTHELTARAHIGLSRIEDARRHAESAARQYTDLGLAAPADLHLLQSELAAGR
ncbi:AfsR/SARP family transcriptional regulator [Nocardia stercoris]|nr:BTAD domain-containing putative transcriptional regulator [Nocardia stercoris]